MDISDPVAAIGGTLGFGATVANAVGAAVTEVADVVGGTVIVGHLGTGLVGVGGTGTALNGGFGALVAATGWGGLFAAAGAGVIAGIVINWCWQQVGDNQSIGDDLYDLYADLFTDENEPAYEPLKPRGCKEL